MPSGIAILVRKNPGLARSGSLVYAVNIPEIDADGSGAGTMTKNRVPIRSRWAAFAEYLGFGGRGRARPVDSPDALIEFVRTRASHVAQTSLYGYLKARAGTRYPELFEHEEFIESINIAKWQVWLACGSDLSVYAGGLLAARAPAGADRVPALMEELVEALLAETGTPDDAGEAYAADADAWRARVRACRWSQITDDEGPFTESPKALAHWAPVADVLKRHDVEIVENSVIFRWIEVRRALRAVIDADAVLADRPDPIAVAEPSRDDR